MTKSHLTLNGVGWVDDREGSARLEDTHDADNQRRAPVGVEGHALLLLDALAHQKVAKPVCNGIDLLRRKRVQRNVGGLMLRSRAPYMVFIIWALGLSRHYTPTLYVYVVSP